MRRGGGIQSLLTLNQILISFRLYLHCIEDDIYLNNSNDCIDVLFPFFQDNTLAYIVNNSHYYN